MKKVSIIIPCYNGQKFIAKAVKSVKNQSYKNIEILIVNNSSTDDSERIAREAAGDDSRFVFLNESKKGISNALNLGISNAKGEFVSFLDQDDVYLDNRIELMLEEMESNELDLLACRGYKVDINGVIFGESKKYSESVDLMPVIFMHHNIVSTLSYIMIKKEALLNFFPLPEKYCWVLDYYLLLNTIWKNHKMSFTNRILVKKSYHDSNFSKNLYYLTSQIMSLLKIHYESNKKVRDFFPKESLGNILTERYVNTVQYMRRNQKENKIYGYLNKYVKSGFIREEFYFYFSAVSLFSIDKNKFNDFVSNKKIEHPMYDFIMGLCFYMNSDFKQAAILFKKAFFESNESFPEALNSLAVAQYYFDKENAERTIKKVIKLWPGYMDPYYNLDFMLVGKENKLRHTFYLTPQTIQFFLQKGINY